MSGRIASVAVAVTILTFIYGLLSRLNTDTQSVRESSAGIPGHYPYVGPRPLLWTAPSPKEISTERPIERLIVKVRLNYEEASWINDLFPTWRTDIVIIPKVFAKSHAVEKRVDKGRVANAYLTWIIENYNNLPETIVFLPPDNDPTVPEKLRNLRDAFVQSSGFANLHCPPATTCANLISPFRSPPRDIRTHEVTMSEAWEHIFGNKNVAVDLATPPSSEFAVSKAQIRKRKVEEYVMAWTWLNRTTMDDDSSGLVFDYLWPFFFGRDPVYCPDFTKCECDLYGSCP